MSEQVRKALIVVDVQNDFCPGGSLAVANGDEVVASRILQIKAKDNNEGQQETVKWTIAAGSLTPSTKLRITMTTKEY